MGLVWARARAERRMAGLLTRVARSDSRMTADRAQRDKFVARTVGLPPRLVTTAFFHRFCKRTAWFVGSFAAMRE